MASSSSILDPMSDAARLTHFARHLRRNPTDAEFALWHVLSTLRPRFTRQLRIGPYVADFACRRARLIIEVDGGQHAENRRDSARTAELEADGWRVLRFWNNDVLCNTDGVAEAIMDAGNVRLPAGESFAAINSRGGRPRKPRTRLPREKGPPPAPPRNRGGE